MNAIRLIVIGLLSLAFSAVYAAVNINSADQKTLEALPGIGASKAQAIIQHREKNGPFKKVEDIIKVKGIGEKFDLSQITVVETPTTTQSVQ